MPLQNEPDGVLVQSVTGGPLDEFVGDGFARGVVVVA